MSLIRGVLLVGKFRTHAELNRLSQHAQRQMLIGELVSRSHQAGVLSPSPRRDFDRLDDDQLAGVGALFVFLRETQVRDEGTLLRMTADEMRNVVIVELDHQTRLGQQLQGWTNLQLIERAAGYIPFGQTLTFAHCLRGALVWGKFRSPAALNAMSEDDMRNTLIVEMANRTSQPQGSLSASPVGRFQAMDSRTLAGVGLSYAFLRDGGIRGEDALTRMTDEDMRNTLIVEVGAQTGLGNVLQRLATAEIVAIGLGVSPEKVLPRPDGPVLHPPPARLQFRLRGFNEYQSTDSDAQGAGDEVYLSAQGTDSATITFRPRPSSGVEPPELRKPIPFVAHTGGPIGARMTWAENRSSRQTKPPPRWRSVARCWPSCARFGRSVLPPLAAAFRIPPRTRVRRGRSTTARSAATEEVSMSVAVRFLAVAALALSSASVSSQSVVQEHVAGLHAPAKLLALPQGELLVAEAGLGANSGRVSFIDRDARRFTVIDGLPSALFLGREPSGPSGLLLGEGRLYVLIGSGDTSIAGAAPTSEILNPNPTSPLFSSVLLLDFPDAAPPQARGFHLAPADHAALAADRAVYLRNADGDSVRVSRLVDIPSAVPEPRPDEPRHVRISNPYGLVGSDSGLAIADASMNVVWTVSLRPAGPLGRLTTIPNVRNPLFPELGGPTSESVPASLRVYGSDLVVSLLTGFPFGPGAASVLRVDRASGAVTPMASGLQTAIDVLPMDSTSAVFDVIEYSRSFLQGGPGRVLRIDVDRGTRLVLADGLRTPTHLARDTRTGDLFVTETAAGRILRVLVPR